MLIDSIFAINLPVEVFFFGFFFTSELLERGRVDQESKTRMRLGSITAIGQFVVSLVVKKKTCTYWFEKGHVTFCREWVILCTLIQKFGKPTNHVYTINRSPNFKSNFYISTHEAAGVMLIPRNHETKHWGSQYLYLFNHCGKVLGFISFDI